MLRFSIIAACLAYSLWRAGRDYLFYLRNKWDFTKDSGISYDWNSDGPPIWLGPRRRLFMAHPIQLAINAFFAWHFYPN